MLHWIDRLAGLWMDWRVRQAVGKIDPAMEPTFKKAEVGDDGRMRILLHSPAIVELAQQCVSLLEASGAENYVAFDMMPRPDMALRPVRVVVSWANGISPAEKAIKLELEVERLKAALAMEAGDG